MIKSIISILTLSICFALPVYTSASTPAYLGTNPRYGRIRPSVMTPDKVAEGALKALGKKALYIPGWNNRLTCFLLTRILRRKTSSKLFNRTTGQMYPDSGF